MTRKKRTLYTAACVITAMTVFTATAFASIQNASGYEKFKNAAINTLQNQQNYTLNVELSAKVNDLYQQYGRETIKYNGENSFSRESISRSGNDTSYYRGIDIIDGDKIGTAWDNKYDPSKSDDGDLRWNVSENYNHGSRNIQLLLGTPFSGSAQIKLFEALADLAIGDAKNYIVTNGTKVTVNLDKNKIPELAQLGIAAVMEAAAMEGNNDQMPIKKDAYFTSVTAEGIIDNNIIEDFKCSIAMEGKDDSNVTHYVTVDVNFSFSDIGTTVPDNLEGKELTNGRSHIYQIDRDEIKKTISESTGIDVNDINMYDYPDENAFIPDISIQFGGDGSEKAHEKAQIETDLSDDTLYIDSEYRISGQGLDADDYELIIEGMENGTLPYEVIDTNMHSMNADDVAEFLDNLKNSTEETEQADDEVVTDEVTVEETEATEASDDEVDTQEVVE